MSGRERHGGGRVAGALGGWLAALRIARREARRARGRTALVVAMVALPALGLSFAAATYDMVRLTPAERATQELGAAQAEVTWPYAGPVEQTPAADWVSSDAPERGAYAAADLLAALPPDSRAISHAQGEVRLRTRTGAGDLPARGLDIADPLTAGMVTVLTGRAPATDREVALTPQAAERLGAGLGDTVRVAAG
ncbi:MAG TPA: ABC transporter permease, partial [Pilimelia sp.]|nr:ABC transporter permease [Pilimelia sp.]